MVKTLIFSLLFFVLLLVDMFFLTAGVYWIILCSCFGKKYFGYFVMHSNAWYDFTHLIICITLHIQSFHTIKLGSN